MAVQQPSAQQQQSIKRRSKKENDSMTTEKNESQASKQASVQRDLSQQQQLAVEDLPPLFLVFTVLVCSGVLFVLAVRDFWLTGMSLGRSWDDAMLIFTKSTQWYHHDDHGPWWKSTSGGFSAIQKFTTDHNNMGGFFVRKMAGAAATGVHLQKLVPILFAGTIMTTSTNSKKHGGLTVYAKWNQGHYRPLLFTAGLANLAIVVFYALYLPDLELAKVAELPKFEMALLLVETIVMLGYSMTSSSKNRGPAVALNQMAGNSGPKTPSSVVSRIVARTIGIVSTALAIIAIRDLLFPGTILAPYFPRDDLYLEWTNALYHSPPEASPESDSHGMEAPLLIGDLFISQYMALHLLILVLYKFVSSVIIRCGADGRGVVQSKMIWKVQALVDAMLLFVVRLFTSAAATASLDLRWHVMCLAYETFILGIYGYF